jgi:phage major head subunit gpT-like protein
MDSVELQSVLITLEESMAIELVGDYQRRDQPENIWWPSLARPRDISSRKETIHWILDTAKIEVRDLGQFAFEDMTTVNLEVTPSFASAAFEIGIEAFQDLENGVWGGKAIEAGTAWARQIGSEMRYFPQRRLADAIVCNPVCYDTHPFFDHGHPTNPNDPSAGTYTNDLDNVAADGWSGVLAPIDESVTVDVALSNAQRVISYIRGLKGPNGRDPRFLRPIGILVPPALTIRSQQLTGAKFIAQAAGATGGGSGDVELAIQKLGLGEPLIAPEIGSGFMRTYGIGSAPVSGSDTTWYVVCEARDVALSSYVYARRETFGVIFHDPGSSAELARKRKKQWTCAGRNEIVPALPYTMFRVHGR